MADYFINRFKIRLEAGADDNELDKLIEEGSELIEDNAEYHRFYETVTEMYRDAISIPWH